MALSRVFSEILNVEKCRDLEIRAKGHSRSLKVVPFDRLCMVSSYAIVTFVFKMRRFFRHSTSKKAVTLKTGLGDRQGHWKCHHAIEHIRLPIDVL